MDSFEDDVITDRNAFMHGNIHRGIYPCYKPGSTGDFRCLGNHFSPPNTNMFPDEKK